MRLIEWSLSSMLLVLVCGVQLITAGIDVPGRSVAEVATLENLQERISSHWILPLVYSIAIIVPGLLSLHLHVTRPQRGEIRVSQYRRKIYVTHNILFVSVLALTFTIHSTFG